jgi:glycosyltransferase involved in cell wall biosynthesis
MLKSKACLLSVVVPVHNESSGLVQFHKSLVGIVRGCAKDSYEILYCDDGSTDDTSKLVKDFHVGDPRVKLIKLSRNFGKENALSAGIAEAGGQAVLMLDGDGQHPVELIPKFIDAWRAGAQVVIGVRTGNNDEGWFKRLGSRLFYKVFNRLTTQKLLPGSTDFRLIDASVRQAFLALTETDRITRGLIDWLGFQREFIYFQANARQQDSASYSRRKLMKLAANSFTSLTPTPLYVFGFLGVAITLVALVLGASVFVEQLLLGDPWHWKFTGTAMLSILLLFLIGIVLMSQGILSLYISHLHSQSKQRPLYIIDYDGSADIESKAGNS